MRGVHVAALERGPIVRTVRLQASAPAAAFSEILYAPLPRRSAVEDVADLLYALPERTRAVAQAVVVRAHWYEAELFMRRDSRATVKLLDRFRRLPVLLARWDESADSFATTILSDGATPDDAALIEDLRSADFVGMTRNPGALLPPSSSFHYAAPNKKHYRSYLRVGSAIQSQESLDSAAFWLLPHITDRTVLVLDSQTILPIALNLAQYVQDVGISKERRVHSVESLRGYKDNDFDELEHRLELTHPHEDRRRHALILSSVASSGSLAQRLRHLVSTLGFDRVDCVALYASPSAALGDALKFALLPRTNEGFEAPCQLCEGGRSEGRSVALRINPETFHVEVAQAVTRSRITQRDARVASAFLRKYRALDVVRLHRTETGGHGRHHAIYVDGSKLLADQSFRRRLRQRARSLSGHVDVVVAPKHPGADQLVHEVGAALGIEPIVCDEDCVDSLTADQRQSIIDARELVIVDDVIITGDRIRGYRQFLMEAGRLAGRVHVLVAVSRPSSSDARQGIRNLVDQMDETVGTFHAIEEVVLPDWGSDECPWCLEREHLSQWLREWPNQPPADVISRLETLSDTSSGLDNNAFWSWDGGELVLGDGSIFAPVDATQAELVFAVASALQTMRSDGRLDEEFVPPVAKVLMHEFWARGRFYAPAISAAILRMAHPHDLIPPIPDRGLQRSVDTRLQEAASHSVRAELLLAIQGRKLPFTRECAQLLENEPGSRGLVQFLKSQLQLDNDRSFPTAVGAD